MINKLLITALCFISLSAKSDFVERVVDGDTIHFKNGDKCRLAYIDTPESYFNQRLFKKVQKCKSLGIDVKDYKMSESGLLAKEYLRFKIPLDRKIDYLIVGVDYKNQRKVCEIKVNNININLLMVEKGYAFPYLKYIKNETTKKIYLKENVNAKMNKRGLYSTNIKTMECLANSSN